MTQTLRFILGLAAPLYCAFLLVGCAYLAHDDWPEGEQTVKTPTLSLPNDTLDPTPAPDFKSIKSIKARKSAFFEYFRPLVEAENQRHSKLRDLVIRLQEIYGQKGFLNAHQKRLLKKLCEEFAVEEKEISAQLAQLNNRVGTLPTALVLAQAATESAWGTSRFARQGNNYFGQWCFSYGCGIVPKQRVKGASHEVAVYTNPAHSVRAYFKNLNTFSAYSDLRTIREGLYRDNQPITTQPLLAGLLRYSEKGEAYIKQLRSIIRQNKLESSSSKGASEKTKNKSL